MCIIIGDVVYSNLPAIVLSIRSLVLNILFEFPKSGCGRALSLVWLLHPGHGNGIQASLVHGDQDGAHVLPVKVHLKDQYIIRGHLKKRLS